MKVIITENYEEMSKKAAEIMIELVKNNPNAVLGLATGSSPIGMYKAMIEDCVKKISTPIVLIRENFEFSIRFLDGVVLAGEKGADIAICGGVNEALLFINGEAVRKIPYDKIIEELKQEILNF